LRFGAPSHATIFPKNVPAPLQGARGLWTDYRACYARLISGSPPGWQTLRQPAFAKGYGGPELMFVGQTSGHFSRKKGELIVRHYRYFFTISQQKPGKRYFK